MTETNIQQLNAPQEQVVYAAAKTLIVACLLQGVEKATIDLDGFHGPLGESGDWQIVCRKKRKWLFW